MTKLITGLIFFIIAIYGCSDKEEPFRKMKKFKSFEIGYTNGWTKGFSFWVDSNKIFMSPQKFDSVKYGILPDSIFQLIDTTLLRIIGDTTIKSKDDGCVDCSIVAMQTIIGSDTITIHQVGNVNKLFWPVISTLQKFIGSSKNSTIHASLFLETQKIAFPPPLPPRSNDRKFLPPKQ